jgi:hypothetical protein
LISALLLLLDFQEVQIVHEACYVESFQPKPEWQEKYFQVKREAREPGLPLVS